MRLTRDETDAVLRLIDWRLNELAERGCEDREYDLLRAAWEILREQTEEK